MKQECNVLLGGYEFKVVFKSQATMGDCDGRTRHNDFTIEVRGDLPLATTRVVLTHEITHALLGTQGRVYQRKFDIEEVCEFIAYRLPEIEQATKSVMEYFIANLYDGEAFK